MLNGPGSKTPKDLRAGVATALRGLREVAIYQSVRLNSVKLPVFSQLPQTLTYMVLSTNPNVDHPSLPLPLLSSSCSLSSPCYLWERCVHPSAGIPPCGWQPELWVWGWLHTAGLVCAALSSQRHVGWTDSRVWQWGWVHWLMSCMEASRSQAWGQGSAVLGGTVNTPGFR
jgi:hypothetical protein